MITLIYRFFLAYMFRNYARIPRPAFPLIIIYCKFQYTQCNTFERETLHGNTTNYLSLLMGDAHNIRHITPTIPPPPDAALFTTGNSCQNCKGYFRKKFK